MFEVTAPASGGVCAGGSSVSGDHVCDSDNLQNTHQINIESAADNTTVTDTLIDYDNHTIESWNTTSLRFEEVPVHSVRTSPRVVSQIDLTPTLSVWLGVNTPYSSLGSVIPELFLSSKGTVRNNNINSGCGGGGEDRLAELLFSNSLQVRVFYCVCHSVCSVLTNFLLCFVLGLAIYE
jgi:hypothetical protein